MIADDYKAIAAGMRRNTWKAHKIASFRCDALPREVPTELARCFVAADGEEQPSDQAVTGLAAVELGLDAQAERLVMSGRW
jgi:hypothetical protein